MNINEPLRSQLVVYQKNEITEHHIYKNLANIIKEPENQKVLLQISADELRHYQQWKTYTGIDIEPNWWKIRFYVLICRVFGITFGIKLMESGEEGAQKSYHQILNEIPEISRIEQDENEHEKALVAMLDEERLHYIGSIVLGLNDALVELTGALAGFTLALQNIRLIALTGLITGIAAALSMAASEYLSTKTEKDHRNPLKASIYTGFAYIFTVIMLILPFLILGNYLFALFFTMIIAILIIAFFNYYIAVVEDVSFKTRFLEMAGLSTGVALISFFIGFLLKRFIGVDI
ncbi:MAG TPA: VIT1/CCC1 transporter family protein [bacterium]|nr:VIT1/CCC1 transporter family protein [bacterium]HPN43324.1 VIT1/CCC1 transporter family protein [bacterium]